MSIEEWYASECEICGGYSNSGFDLCEECAMKFTVWFFLKHYKNADKIINEEFILDDKDNLWNYSRISDFIGNEYEKFKKESNENFNLFKDKLKSSPVKKILKGSKTCRRKTTSKRIRR